VREINFLIPLYQPWAMPPILGSWYGLGIDLVQPWHGVLFNPNNESSWSKSEKVNTLLYLFIL